MGPLPKRWNTGGIYESKAARLDVCNPLADLSHNNLGDVARTRMTPVGRAFTDMARDDRIYSGRGPLGLGRAAGSASRTSGAINDAGKAVRVVGAVGLAASVINSGVRIATAGRSCRARVAAEEVGGLAGSLAYGFVGAKIGATIGLAFGPWGELLVVLSVAQLAGYMATVRERVRGEDITDATNDRIHLLRSKRITV